MMQKYDIDHRKQLQPSSAFKNPPNLVSEQFVKRATIERIFSFSTESCFFCLCIEGVHKIKLRRDKLSTRYPTIEKCPCLFHGLCLPFPSSHSPPEEAPKMRAHDQLSLSYGWQYTSARPHTRDERKAG